jgi:WD40 repeat protein
MKNNITIGLAIGLLIAILSTLLAWGQRNQAISQANIAAMAEKTAKMQRATTEAKVSTLQTANTQLVTQQAVAETKRDQAMEQLRLTRSRQLAAQALNLLDEQLDLALLLSVEAGRIADTGAARGSLHEALTYKPNLTFLHGHQNSFEHTGIAILSPDGQILVSSSCYQGLPWVPCNDIELRFWDVTTHQPLGLVHPGHKDAISSLAFSPDGQIVASGSDYDTTIRLWDVSTQQLIGQLSTDEIYKVSGLRFSPDGQILASWTDNTLTRWDITTMQPIGQPLTFTMQIVTLSPDQQTLALSRDSDLTLWNVATNQAIGPPLTGHTEPVSEAIFSPDGKLLASCDTNNAIILWDVSTGQSLNQTFKTHGGETHFSAFSSDG